MKSYQIFLSLILFFLLSSLTNEQEPELGESSVIYLTDNEMRVLNLSKDDNLEIHFNKKEGQHFIRLFSQNGTNIKIQSLNSKLADIINIEKQYIDINISSSEFTGENGYIIVTVNQDNTHVEISSVVLQNTTGGGIYAYQNKTYSIDTEEKVESNNFVIFLDNEQDYEKFDLKFKFNENSEAKNTIATFGFICLPNNNPEYIPLAKYMKEIGNLTEHNITNVEFEEKIVNKFPKKDIREPYKPMLAFIFSVDVNTKQTFSYSINSEIINIFLIVSIVIALVFAVITFFLIRRKQSADSNSIEGAEGLLKGDKEEGEGEGKEKGEKGENEKEEKEGDEKEEKEDKVINDENAEQEEKKIEAAEN